MRIGVQLGMRDSPFSPSWKLEYASQTNLIILLGHSCEEDYHRVPLHSIENI